jgi:putative phosphoribosyl transferase
LTVFEIEMSTKGCGCGRPSRSGRWAIDPDQGARRAHGGRYGVRTSPPFSDRSDAGRRLAKALAAKGLDNVAVYALPRGGVPVAREVALTLRAPMDLLLVRKIGAPDQPELALAAVAEGGGLVINETVRRYAAVDDAWLDQARQDAMREIERRRAAYLGGRARIDPKGRTAIVVDDGLATGATAKAAIRALKAGGAGKVILAAPVATPDVVAELEREADEVVCLATPTDFMGVGAFYLDFHQLTDAETIALLDQARGSVDEP